MKIFFRWLCVLPAAILGAYFITIISWLATNYTLGISLDEPSVIRELEKNLIWGGAFVGCGSMMAPKYRKQVSLVLSVILIALAIRNSIYKINTEGFSFWVIVNNIVLILGVICGCSAVHEDVNPSP